MLINKILNSYSLINAMEISPAIRNFNAFQDSFRPITSMIPVVHEHQLLLNSVLRPFILTPSAFNFPNLTEVIKPLIPMLPALENYHLLAPSALNTGIFSLPDSFCNPMLNFPHAFHMASFTIPKYLETVSLPDLFWTETAKNFESISSLMQRFFLPVETSNIFPAKNKTRIKSITKAKKLVLTATSQTEAKCILGNTSLETQQAYYFIKSFINKRLTLNNLSFLTTFVIYQIQIAPPETDTTALYSFLNLLFLLGFIKILSNNP